MDGEPPTELITVEGRDYRVRKRYQHSTASRVFSASFLVSNMQRCNKQFKILQLVVQVTVGL